MSILLTEDLADFIAEMNAEELAYEKFQDEGFDYERSFDEDEPCDESANPYAAGTKEHLYWARGFDLASDMPRVL